MVVDGFHTYFCEIGPLILESLASSFEVFLQGTLIDFRVVHKITINKGDLLVGDILLLDVT